MDDTKLALVAVESRIERDPRVSRQIDWLTQDGWRVDSLGLGDSSALGVRDHFPIADVAPWKLTKFGTAVIYGLLSHRKKFEVLTLARFPAEVRSRVRNGDYDLIILNDRHFVPWIAERRDFTSAALSGHVHLDLHEYFIPKLKRDSLWRIATASYYEWCRRLFAHRAFTSRSTVNSGIAKLYAAEFDIATPAVIRNSPPFVDLEPSDVDPENIKLIHHGTARWDRGLRQMIDAVRMSDRRIELTLMLVGEESVLAELRDLFADIADRVALVPPVQMESLAQEVNQYDLEVIFYEPTSKNLELALPNKLFEAVQGRLGLLIGPSPEMVKIIETYGNGAVAAGWAPSQLAEVLNGLDAESVAKMKWSSHNAASELNSETERKVFRDVVSGDGVV